MHREKLTICDVGMTLDAEGKLAFCKEAEGFAVTNLIILFGWSYAGKEEDGRDAFDIALISSAWFHTQEKNAQHFTGTVNGQPEINPLHGAALAFVQSNYWDEILERAQSSYDENRYYKAAA